MSLRIRDVRKAFGSTLVLDQVDLAVEAREFIAFLGPSGSGKSTLLRIIAGLETADSGEVWLDERRIDRLGPGERGVAMVFQHYALYPHMSVRENMAFGLRNAGIGKDEIDRRIGDAAAVLQIEPLLDRKPAQMSGGQRQRVAIGRALVKEPKLFLLDEPLSNLDAALRLRTRVELAQLKQRVSAPVIMVTHDQAEAMTLADRIVVINDQRIQQVGTPMEIYSRPANDFVARFVGSPAMTIMPAELVESKGAHAADAVVRIGDGTTVQTGVPRHSLPDDCALRLGIRAEAVRPGGPAAAVNATVELVERLGDRSLVYAKLADGQPITAEDDGDCRLRIGDKIALSIDGTAAHLFDSAGRAYHRATS